MPGVTGSRGQRGWGQLGLFWRGLSSDLRPVPPALRPSERGGGGQVRQRAGSSDPRPFRPAEGGIQALSL